MTLLPQPLHTSCGSSLQACVPSLVTVTFSDMWDIQLHEDIYELNIRTFYEPIKKICLMY